VLVPAVRDSVAFWPLVGMPVDGRVGSTDVCVLEGLTAPAPGPEEVPGPAAPESPIPPPPPAACAIAVAPGAMASAAAKANAYVLWSIAQILFLVPPFPSRPAHRSGNNALTGV
jgi:hypothetical protein